MTWPDSAEDRLLSEYLALIPGELFLEVPIGSTEGNYMPYRIDGLLLPGGEDVVHPWGYSSDEIRERIRGQAVHLIEAKIYLNRNVVGQVVAGRALLEREYDPGEVHLVIVCERGQPDIEWACAQHGIEVRAFSVTTDEPEEPDEVQVPDVQEGRVDVRRPPDPARRRAFLGGWSAAVDGNLYSTVHVKKTHANMGNLFGWIYGDQPYDFRIATWERYVANAEPE